MAKSNQAAYSAFVDDTDDFIQNSSRDATSIPQSTTESAAKPDRRAQVLTGPLPDGFLQMESTSPMHQVAYQPTAFGGFHQSTYGMLTVTIVQARLAKNYGMTRMDPFCRVRIGAMVFETPTSYNGSKTPRWNKVIQSQLAPNVKEFLIEIYDERTFTMDEKIAWGLIKIKDECFEGKSVDEWYPLNGKQGDGKEGMIHVIMQYKEGVVPMMMNPMMGGTPLMIQQQVPYGPGIVYGYPQMMYPPPQVVPPNQTMTPQHPQRPPQPGGNTVSDTALGQINEKDLKALKEMCPSLDDDIIRSVYQQSGENIDRAAAQLLEMSAS